MSNEIRNEEPHISWMGQPELTTQLGAILLTHESLYHLFSLAKKGFEKASTYRDCADVHEMINKGVRLCMKLGLTAICKDAKIETNQIELTQDLKTRVTISIGGKEETFDLSFVEVEIDEAREPRMTLLIENDKWTRTT